MPPNYVHKIVHISTLFYQSLSITSLSGRKLLKKKNSKFFYTPNTCMYLGEIGVSWHKGLVETFHTVNFTPLAINHINRSSTFGHSCIK